MYIFFEKNAFVLGITSTHFQSICIFPVNAIYITLFFFCLTQRLNRGNNGICNQFNLIYMDCTYGLLLKHSFISQFQMDGGDLFDTLQTYF